MHILRTFQLFNFHGQYMLTCRNNLIEPHLNIYNVLNFMLSDSKDLNRAHPVLLTELMCNAAADFVYIVFL